MENITENQAAELLIDLYLRQCFVDKYYKTQTAFDEYVVNWCENSGLIESELTEQELKEIAFSAIVYDGFFADFN